MVKVDQMDPGKPPDLTEKMGAHWLGRGRGLQLGESAVGRGRGLLLSTEEPVVGRGRAFPTFSDNSLGLSGAVPITEPVVGRGRALLAQQDIVVGRARGLLVPAVESKVGVARSAGILRLDPQEGRTPPSETMMPALMGESPTLTKEEVRTRKCNKLCFNFNGEIATQSCTGLLSSDRLASHHMLKDQHWSQCLEEWALNHQRLHWEEEQHHWVSIYSEKSRDTENKQSLGP